MKIVTVVGARPQFIKAAVVSRQIRKFHKEIIIHTGQHYDENMSDIFFNELDIPMPDYNLGITAKTHGEMTGRMLIEIEKVLMIERPDMLIVYGDTNSTVAGALAAVKLHIPVLHIEAGVRMETLINPEEVNRVLTDRISTYLMCCTKSSIEFLEKEGITNNVFLVGDPMYDAFCYYSQISESMGRPDLFLLSGDKIAIPPKYYYMTCHREENTDEASLNEILSAMNSLSYPSIYPVHPRNTEKVIKLNHEKKFDNIRFVNPVGYLTSVFLVNNAQKIITDSGGLQREAYFAHKQCITILDSVAWPETMGNNWNSLAKPERKDIFECVNRLPVGDQRIGLFGNGNSGEMIVEIINEKLTAMKLGS